MTAGPHYTRRRIACSLRAAGCNSRFQGTVFVTYVIRVFAKWQKKVCDKDAKNVCKPLTL